ncbi:hypothetical protein ATANTOWER_004721 [Ataeniobius toweri]|uniref:Uncharacterized protein n=1 Tax=Ataeniobius toweri TaxID=208326 RepID=A0ABU7BEA1_9TELE|nr:hypothetical protein [Ataeniobius toweri]
MSIRRLTADFWLLTSEGSERGHGFQRDEDEEGRGAEARTTLTLYFPEQENWPSIAEFLRHPGCDLKQVESHDVAAPWSTVASLKSQPC